MENLFQSSEIEPSPESPAGVSIKALIEEPVVISPAAASAQQRTEAALPRLSIEELPVCHGPVCVGEHRYVTLSSNANYALDTFDLMDGDKDGYVDKDEIASFEKRFARTIDRDEQKMLDVYKANIDGWQTLSNDEWGRERSGVSREDLWAVRKEEQARSTAADVRRVIARHFDAMDSNHDGVLEPDEIRQFAEQHDFERPVSERWAAEILLAAAKYPPSEMFKRSLPFGSPFQFFHKTGIDRANAELVAKMTESGFDWSDRERIERKR
ncbi:MAG: hypothetical protein AB7W16_04750 [Candidatus Obscuribacterales bacterium]